MKSRRYRSATFGTPSGASQRVTDYIASGANEDALAAEAQRKLTKKRKEHSAMRREFMALSPEAFRSYIHREIRRLTSKHAGIPPSERLFSESTGITNLDWCPVLWRRWADALAEVGFSGCVYLARSGFNRGQYKIGHRKRAPLPDGFPKAENLTLVHVIYTDDPAGIELYWRKRFAKKKIDNQWFGLTSEEVSDFKRREYQ